MLLGSRIWQESWMETPVNAHRTAEQSAPSGRGPGAAWGADPALGRKGRGGHRPRGGGSQAEEGPRTEDLGMPPLPWPGPHPTPQARRPHPYLGHCIPLWAPRSQRCVRLEGSERKIRSQVAGAGGGGGGGWCGRGGRVDAGAWGLGPALARWPLTCPVLNLHALSPRTLPS